MKNIIISRYSLLTLAFLTSFLAPKEAVAGHSAPTCWLVCGAQCAFYEEGGPRINCIRDCMAICLSNCFSERTNVTVLKDGVSNRKNIADVKKGDIVATLKDGTAGWTTVSRNLKTEGEVEFLQITTRSLKTGNYNEIEVTPQHGLVLSNVHNTLTIDSAKHIEIGDHLLGVNNEVLVVVDISTHTMNAKHTLETSDGTVFASDLFTTTLCNDEVAGGERLFDPTMNDWRMRHNFSNTP